MKITSYQASVAAKNAIIKLTKKLYGEIYTIQEVQAVWFCKTLQHTKGLFIIQGAPCRFYEVTFDGIEEQMFIDVYTKTSNSAVPREQFKFTVDS